MEVKINREIRDYTESMFFGLSLRQFIFSVLAVGVAIGIYFGLGFFGTETVSWMCVLGLSFAALGFIKYHGMTASSFYGRTSNRSSSCPKADLLSDQHLL